MLYKSSGFFYCYSDHFFDMGFISFSFRKGRQMQLHVHFVESSYQINIVCTISLHEKYNKGTIYDYI